MSGIQNERVSLGQRNGPEVELIISGTKQYATYETPDGYPAVYDEPLGLYCYARVEGGRYRSTGVPIHQPPPAGAARHAKESDAVRETKIRSASGEQRSQSKQQNG